MFRISERIKSFSYAFKGLAAMMHHQHNFYIHITLTVIALTLAYILDITKTELLFIIVAIGMVLSAEIFNTAIEKLTNLVQPNHDPKAGIIKDLAAAAVLITAICALIIGLIIFTPYLTNLI
ncbi:MAG: diacylglycerol kinase family protein [Bacteroidetes bacterium]|nr:MAG: diacylglycerol kinase family protein [Bacteroidota bacterium]